MSDVASKIAELANELENELSAVSTELTQFPSGAGMLDVRRGDRLFVMSYTPSQGFGVDELKPRDGFKFEYEFTSDEFASAAGRLRTILSNADSPTPSVAPRSLNLVVIYSRDMNAAKEFYGCLGIMTLQTERHGSGPEHASADLNGAIFEIYPGNDRNGNGKSRIGFRLPSVDRAVDVLRQPHAKVVSQPHDSPWGRRAVVEDPDGNRVELTQDDPAHD